MHIGDNSSVFGQQLIAICYNKMVIMQLILIVKVGIFLKKEKEKGKVKRCVLILLLNTNIDKLDFAVFGL